MSKIIRAQDTRRTFVETLDELAKDDPSIVVLIPDVGFLYLDGEHNFKVINTGVTEQSTILIAAGMALSGMKPYVYSMINFVLFRPFEMIRNGVVKHRANVKLIGVKGSEKYKMLGFSHNLSYPEEDIDTCKLIGLDYEIATTNEEVKNITESSYKVDVPLYIRL